MRQICSVSNNKNSTNKDDLTAWTHRGALVLSYSFCQGMPSILNSQWNSLCRRPCPLVTQVIVRQFENDLAQEEVFHWNKKLIIIDFLCPQACSPLLCRGIVMMFTLPLWCVCIPSDHGKQNLCNIWMGKKWKCALWDNRKSFQPHEPIFPIIS